MAETKRASHETIPKRGAGFSWFFLIYFGPESNWYTLWWTNIAMENGHWIFPLKIVIFHCYISSPEGTWVMSIGGLALPPLSLFLSCSLSLSLGLVSEKVWNSDIWVVKSNVATRCLAMHGGHPPNDSRWKAYEFSSYPISLRSMCCPSWWMWQIEMLLAGCWVLIMVNASNLIIVEKCFHLYWQISRLWAVLV